MPFNITERELDLIQLEEMHSDSGYAAWFADRIGRPNWQFVQARHSVSAQVGGMWGETDLFAIYENADRRLGVLIEDKISAAFTDAQAERYHERGLALIDDGEVDDYVTVLVAPDQYLGSVPLDRPWHVRVAVEEIAEWFEAAEGHHAQWRANALRRAVERTRRIASPGAEAVARFSVALANYLARHHAPTLFHRSGRDTSGPTFRFPGSSGSKTLWWKFASNQMILQLMDSYRGVAERLDLPFGVELERAEDHGRRSDYLAVIVPPVDPGIPLEDQLGPLEEAIDAAYKLVGLVPRLEEEAARVPAVDQ